MTAERPSWAPQNIDLDRPNAARIYDYFLGGACNFEHDREFADKFLEIMPEAETAARRNRAFLRRAVRFCVNKGIRQFLDLGSGIPTVGNVHEIAQGMDPACRVLYVDNEPVAVAHSELMLEDVPNAAILQADLCDADTVLNSVSARQLLDFDEPMALLIVSVLHFVPDASDPASAVARYLKVMAPGSYFVFSHGTTEGFEQDPAEAANAYRRTTNPGVGRSREEILAFMSGLELLEPGLVWTPMWRPDSPEDVGENPERSLNLAAVARKS
ncbi:MAG TPA: SAM-dependent methyltransferase [Actinophytocola sp.]|uniref:SAM-dependent methyltransferase n=1 Tax=Actinophytocola sp. TaxID=1872138 RepID=UPI002DB6722A|nr:SAM-dependent methyltransferase [Actinophytocola sp.]HEU5474156.1 SAM-dependent methyltransferase [Actinophytocola sp.]